MSDKSHILTLYLLPPLIHTDPLMPFQPSPHRRDERPVSCYTPSSNSNLGPGGLGKDKQRAYMPSLVNNETYGTILNASPPQTANTSAPPLPPRNLGKVRYRE